MKLRSHPAGPDHCHRSRTAISMTGPDFSARVIGLHDFRLIDQQDEWEAIHELAAKLDNEAGSNESAAAGLYGWFLGFRPTVDEEHRAYLIRCVAAIDQLRTARRTRH